jgi:hypothetical protein
VCGISEWNCVAPATMHSFASSVCMRRDSWHGKWEQERIFFISSDADTRDFLTAWQVSNFNLTQLSSTRCFSASGKSFILHLNQDFVARFTLVIEMRVFMLQQICFWEFSSPTLWSLHNMDWTDSCHACYVPSSSSSSSRIESHPTNFPFTCLPCSTSGEELVFGASLYSSPVG